MEDRGKIRGYAVLVTSDKCLNAWRIMLKYWGPPINFEGWESKWHWKLRSLKQYIENLIHSVRMKVFPYALVRLGGEVDV